MAIVNTLKRYLGATPDRVQLAATIMAGNLAATLDGAAPAVEVDRVATRALVLADALIRNAKVTADQ